MSEFHAACAAGDKLAVEAVLGASADSEKLHNILHSREPNKPEGQTPLHTACEHGHAAIVHMLLEAAPYSRMLTNLTAARRPKEKSKRRNSFESLGAIVAPLETPVELAIRLGQRKCAMIIERFADDERDLAHEQLALGLSRLSSGDPVGAMEAAQLGLNLDPVHADCRQLSEIAEAKLAASVEEILQQGNADEALELVSAHLALAPASELLLQTYERSEMLAAKMSAAKERSRQVGHSLVQYERAAKKMVGDANAKVEEAKGKQAEAEEAARVAEAWEQRCEEQEEINDTVRNMWQERAIRKQQKAAVTAVMEAWFGWMAMLRTHKTVLRRTVRKIQARTKMLVWRGWLLHHRMHHVEAANATAAEAMAEAGSARAAEKEANNQREMAEIRAERMHEREGHAQTKATAECNLRAATERRAAAALADAEQERAGRLAVEASQQHTRDAWIAEKRTRVAAEERVLDLETKCRVLERKLADSDGTLSELRRQSIASRYDAWSGRKVGKLPSIDA
jgi:hypothetical protein